MFKLMKHLLILLIILLPIISATSLQFLYAEEIQPQDGVIDRSTNSQKIAPVMAGNGKRRLSHLQLRSILENNNRPISFYGKVIDQDGQPVGGVEATIQIRYTKKIFGSGISDTFKYLSVKTDAEGLFNFTKARGSLMTVKALVKPGYEASEKGLRRVYWYTRDPKNVHHPEPDKPEIYLIWKKAGAEKLIRQGLPGPLPYNGTPLTLDLLNLSEVHKEDIRVTLVRNPQHIEWGQHDYEWTLTIEVVNGGLIESKDEQMYRAPEQGYQPKVVIRKSANDPGWTDHVERELYLKLRDGKYYGRAELYVMLGSDRAAAPFGITSFVNPSGSRNLEYDPLQDLIKQ